MQPVVCWLNKKISMPRMGMVEMNFQVDLLRLNYSICETEHVGIPNNLSLGVTSCHTRVHNSKLNNRSSLVGIQTEGYVLT